MIRWSEVGAWFMGGVGVGLFAGMLCVLFAMVVRLSLGAFSRDV